jgi:hypothetical protein
MGIEVFLVGPNRGTSLFDQGLHRWLQMPDCLSILYAIVNRLSAWKCRKVA